MSVDVLKYVPILTYTDEPIEDPAPFTPGTELWLWRMKVELYWKVERARRNPMLLATNVDGAPLYKLSESGSLRRTFPLSDSRRRAVIDRDVVCVRCGSPDRLEVDHIVRYVDGGGNEMENLRVLCHACHGSRGGR